MKRLKIDNAENGIRSNQNLSCNWTGSADFGRLVPIHWEEMLPTDKVVRFRPRVEMQMLPLASPTFSKIDLYVHGFVVPIRQIHEHFYDIWSRVGDYKDSTLQYLPPIAFANFYSSLTGDVSNLRSAFYKHMTSMGLNPFFANLNSQGSPINEDRKTPIWLAPFFAYNKIWWDFYRDPELLRDENALDYLYKGDCAGVIPSGFNQQEFFLHYLMPHVRSIKNNWLSDLFAQSGYEGIGRAGVGTAWYNDFQWGSTFGYPSSDEGPISNDINEPTSPSLSDIDLEQQPPHAAAMETTSLNVRLIEALTRLSERLSLSGKRQIEALFARYGVKPTWSKMNLARYVGGAKASVLVSDIINSSDTSVESTGSGLPLGAKAGQGFCALDNLSFEFSVDEPSIFMCVASVMPHIHFVQGLSKKWQRCYLQDMFQSHLQYVGNVAVAKKEVGYHYDTEDHYSAGNDNDVFAYTDPYYEYKYGQDILAGDFMKYHKAALPSDPAAEYQVSYMQSMENYIDYPSDRTFEYTNMLVDGDQYNKIFSYLGGSLWQGGDDHFHISVDKEFIVNRPMEGFAIPTLETTQNPHVKKEALSSDKML